MILTYNDTELTNLIKRAKSEAGFNANSRRLPKKPRFTLSNKINFAYSFYNMVGNQSILDVLDNTENPDLKHELSSFIVKFNLLKPYPNVTSEWYSPRPNEEINNQRAQCIGIKTITEQYNHQNWLEPFDEDAMFDETLTKHPTYHIFLDENGNPIKFDKPAATNVKLAIIDQDIIPARCIVEGAYPYVAQGKFRTYIKQIKQK